MTTNLQIKKPVDAITVEDINKFPIWAFASEENDDDQDETYISPVNSNIVKLGEYSLSVAANFKTSSGIEIKGLIGISTDDGIEIEGASLLFNGQYIFVPPSGFWDVKSEYEVVAKSLDMTIEEVFPLSFTLLVPVEGENKPVGGVFSL